MIIIITVTIAIMLLIYIIVGSCDNDNFEIFIVALIAASLLFLGTLFHFLNADKTAVALMHKDGKIEYQMNKATGKSELILLDSTLTNTFKLIKE